MGRALGVTLQGLVLGTLLYVALWQLAAYRVAPKEAIKEESLQSPTTARIFRYQGY
jgi:hypothetical protein